MKVIKIMIPKEITEHVDCHWQKVEFENFVHDFEKREANTCFFFKLIPCFKFDI